MKSQWNAIDDHDSSPPYMFVYKKISKPNANVMSVQSKRKLYISDNWNDDQDFNSIYPFLSTCEKKLSKLKWIWTVIQDFFCIMGSMNSMVSKFAIKFKTTSLLRSRSRLNDSIGRNKTPNNIIWFQVTLMALLNPSCGWKYFFWSTGETYINTAEHRNEFKSNNNSNKIEVYGVYQRCLWLGLLHIYVSLYLLPCHYCGC